MTEKQATAINEAVSQEPAIALFDNVEAWEEQLSLRQRRTLVFE
ncbi:MAG TPA: hypothetical protein VE621_06305 [Bryobacteraceae bacterium]|nr:hypothetical protein [Bryobacteraceae bacterium]